MRFRREFTNDNVPLLREMLELRRQGMSFPQIARYFQKDHTTVMYHCKKHHVYPGCPPLSFEEFFIKKERPVVQKAKEPKYAHLIFEEINMGKTSYEEYVKAEDMRIFKKHAIHTEG